jgi:hypothetical protein
MAKLPGTTGITMIEKSIEHYPGPDASADRNSHKTCGATAVAEKVLCKRERIHIVIGPDRNSGSFRD